MPITDTTTRVPGWTVGNWNRVVVLLLPGPRGLVGGDRSTSPPITLFNGEPRVPRPVEAPGTGVKGVRAPLVPMVATCKTTVLPALWSIPTASKSHRFSISTSTLTGIPGWYATERFVVISVGKEYPVELKTVSSVRMTVIGGVVVVVVAGSLI